MTLARLLVAGLIVLQGVWQAASGTESATSVSAAEGADCCVGQREGYVTTWVMEERAATARTESWIPVDREAPWECLVTAGTDPKRPGIVELDKFVKSHTQEIFLTTWIASTRDHREVARDVILKAGSSSKIDVRLGGKTILTREEDRPYQADQDNVQVGLGGFTLLQVRATRPVGPWLLSFRLVPVDKKPGEIRSQVKPVLSNEASEPVAEARFMAVEAKPIFDGKTLEGWEGDPRWFQVEDGAIACGSLEGGAQVNYYLMTKKDYGDFDLRIKAKAEGQKHWMNSGVYFRAHRVPQSTEAHGYQADMSHDRGWGWMYDERSTRVIGLKNRDIPNQFDPSGWNEYQIRCVGPKIQIWLNGTLVIDFTEHNSLISRRGKIGLQFHGYKGDRVKSWFKDITVKELCE